MNRENKRKQFEKGYYKTHACEESFTCKVCGRLVVSAGAGSGHRNYCPTAFPVSIWTMSQETGVRTAAGLWSLWAYGCGKTASGR